MSKKYKKNDDALNWDALAEHECPKCGKPLEEEETTHRYECSSFDCAFSISQEKFEDIVESIEDRDDGDYGGYDNNW